MTTTILFLLFALVTLAGAIGTVTERKLFHAALWMLLSFFGVAALYVLLEAPFFAAVQLFIYMGAIGILIIFALMLTRGSMREGGPYLNDQWWLVALLSVVLLVVVGWLVWQQYGGVMAVHAVDEGSLVQLGRALSEQDGYALPFEVASVLLVMALIGAVTIVRER